MMATKILKRPGVFLSLLAHAGFLLWLAYALAFKMPPKVEEKNEDLPLILVPPPPPPPPPPRIDTAEPIFKPQLTPRIVGVATEVPPLPLTPVIDLVRPRPAVVAEEHSVVVQPKVISRMNPLYPDRALDQNISGFVDVEGTVAPDGSFSDGRIITETPEGYGFAKALLKVIPRWKFEPKTVNGIAVPYRIRYRFSFALMP
jgi:protein TonB